MTIDPETLLNFSIPEVRQHLTRRDTVLYALSVGLGADPMDERQLDYVDHHRALMALPSMPVVLGHPGFWLTDPRTGVDAVRLVHGEQEIKVLRPLPVEGEIIGRTRVTGLVDKGAGRGSLLYSEKQVLDADSGALLATTHSTTFLRGDGGFGGPSGPVRPAHPAPEGEPDLVVDLPTRPEQALLYRLNGDDNKLHSTRRRRRRPAFPARSCTGSAPSASSRTRCCGRWASTTLRGSTRSRCASPRRCSPARPSAPRSGATAASAPGCWNATPSW